MMSTIIKGAGLMVEIVAVTLLILPSVKNALAMRKIQLKLQTQHVFTSYLKMEFVILKITMKNVHWMVGIAWNYNLAVCTCRITKMAFVMMAITLNLALMMGMIAVVTMQMPTSTVKFVDATKVTSICSYLRLMLLMSMKYYTMVTSCMLIMGKVQPTWAKDL